MNVCEYLYLIYSMVSIELEFRNMYARSVSLFEAEFEGCETESEGDLIRRNLCRTKAPGFVLYDCRVQYLVVVEAVSV